MFHLRFGLLMVDKSTDHEKLIVVVLLKDRSLNKQVNELILFPYHRNKLRQKILSPSGQYLLSWYFLDVLKI